MSDHFPPMDELRYTLNGGDFYAPPPWWLDQLIQHGECRCRRRHPTIAVHENDCYIGVAINNATMPCDLPACIVLGED